MSLPAPEGTPRNTYTTTVDPEALARTAQQEQWGGGEPWLRDLMVRNELGLPIGELPKDIDLDGQVALEGLRDYMDHTARYASTIPSRPSFVGNPELQRQVNTDFYNSRQQRLTQIGGEVTRAARLVARLSGANEDEWAKEQRARMDAYSESYDTGTEYDRKLQKKHGAAELDSARDAAYNKSFIAGVMHDRRLSTPETQTPPAQPTGAKEAGAPLSRRPIHWWYRGGHRDLIERVKQLPRSLGRRRKKDSAQN